VARLLLIPKPIMNTVILILCVVGTFGIQGGMFDVYVMVFFAILGYLMSKFSFPRAPIVLALILGPLMEENLRRWLSIHEGDAFASLFRTFSTNPISAVIFIVTILSLVMPLFRKKKGKFTEEGIKEITEEVNG